MNLVKNERTKVSKHVLYYRAYGRTLDRYNDNPNRDIKTVTTAVKRLIFYGTKALNSLDHSSVFDAELVEYRLCFANVIKNLMASLTPAEFMNLFPIIKEFDGDKWEAVDYFHTKKFMNELDQDKPIGEKILNLLLEYHNTDVRFFTVRLMSLMNDFGKSKGYPGMWATGSHDNVTQTKPGYPSYLRVVH